MKNLILFTGSAIFAQLGAQLGAIKLFIVAVFLLLGLDLITGIWRSVKKARGEAKEKKESLTFWQTFHKVVKSSRLKDTVAKLVNYSIAIIAAQVITAIFIPEFLIAYYVAAFVCLIEFKSILENVSETTGVNLLGYVKGLFKRKYDAAIEKSIEKDKQEREKAVKAVGDTDLASNPANDAADPPDKD